MPGALVLRYLFFKVSEDVHENRFSTYFGGSNIDNTIPRYLGAKVSNIKLK